MSAKRALLIFTLSTAIIGQLSSSAGDSASAVAADQATDRPSVPTADILAQPRPRKQVGLPEQLTEAAIPADDPLTPKKTATRETLFSAARLPRDGPAGASPCHNPALAFTDGRPVSIGIHGAVGQRNSPTILNALYNKAQFWDGRANTLEEQAA